MSTSGNNRGAPAPLTYAGNNRDDDDVDGESGRVWGTVTTTGEGYQRPGIYAP